MPIPLAILGAGAWGLTVALVLAQKRDHRVRVWVPRPATAAELSRRRESPAHLPGVVLPPEIELTADLATATADAELLVSAVPTVYLRATLAPVTGQLPKTCPALSLS